MTMTEAVDRIVADLEQNPPATVTEARAKLQDLLVYLIPQPNKFPRDQKFVLGDRIET